MADGSSGIPQGQLSPRYVEPPPPVEMPREFQPRRLARRAIPVLALLTALGLVVVLIRDLGRHPGSEAEVELLAGSLWTVRAGKITRVELYANREDLFEASGFRPRC